MGIEIKDISMLIPTKVQMLLAIGLTVALSGCAFIERINSDGATERSVALAAPLIASLAPTGESSVVRIVGLGFSVANNTATLGLFDETVAALGPDCRVVLIGGEEQSARIGAARRLCADKVSKDPNR